MDGTPGVGAQGLAGVAAVIRGPLGLVWTWRSACVAATTCNEAEYLAVICGLQLVLERYPHAHVRCLSDSRIVVDQLSRRVAVRAGALQDLYAQANALASRLPHIAFRHIPRELNRLADALAWEALEGRAQIAAHLDML